MIISTNSIIKKKQEILSASVDEEVVVLGLKSGNYFGFNRVGSDIWDRLEKPIKVERLISDLQEIYSADSVQLTKDVLDFLNAIYEKGLLEQVNEIDL